jgi:hypothetical protein
MLADIVTTPEIQRSHRTSNPTAGPKAERGVQVRAAGLLEAAADFGEAQQASALVMSKTSLCSAK